MLASLATGLSTLGLGAALTQARNVERQDAAAVLGLALIASLVLALALSLGAPSLGRVFRADELGQLLPVYSLALPIAAPTGVAMALLRRELRFGALARLQLIGVLLNAAGSLSLAALGLGVWSLVWGRILAEAGVLVVAVRCARAPWLPLFAWSRARRFVRFGSQVAGSQVLIAAGNRIDTAILAGALGAASLGEYTLAVALVMAPAVRVASVVKGVAFSALSRLDPDAPQFERQCTSLLRHIAAVCAPLVAGLAYVAEDAVHLLLGEGWEQTPTILRCLAPAGFVGALGSAMGAIVLSRGHAHVELGFAALRILGMGALIALGVQLAAAPGAALGVTAYNLLGFPLFFLVLRRWGGLATPRVLGAIAPGTLAALWMGVPVLAVQAGLDGLHPSLRLAVSAALGALAYGAALRLLFPATFAEIRGTIASLSRPAAATSGAATALGREA